MSKSHSFIIPTTLSVLTYTASATLFAPVRIPVPDRTKRYTVTNISFMANSVGTVASTLGIFFFRNAPAIAANVVLANLSQDFGLQSGLVVDSYITMGSVTGNTAKRIWTATLGLPGLAIQHDTDGFINVLATTSGALVVGSASSKINIRIQELD